MIDRVNHGQVASGELPDVVIERDIDAEVDGEEAYKRYAEATIAFIVTTRFFYNFVTFQCSWFFFQFKCNGLSTEISK